ncbi:MAG TPA: hypothetical protein VEQ65_13455 [Opitutus sp.]|nr:hypothetical protein [Opitutus sp.]
MNAPCSPASPARALCRTRSRRRRVEAVLLVALTCALAACSSPPAPPRVDNLPMYGQPAIPRPTQLKQADAAFVASAVTEFRGDRKLASIAWSGQAERFLKERNLDYAMRRYNQAWLLDPENHEVYWGFGRVLAETERFDEAIPHLQKGLELCTEPAERAAILCDLAAAYSAKAGTISPDLPATRAAAFALANQMFAHSTEANAAHADAWRRWAISLASEGKLADAADKARRAAELGAAPLPAATRALIEARVSRTP